MATHLDQYHDLKQRKTHQINATNHIRSFQKSHKKFLKDHFNNNYNTASFWEGWGIDI